MPTSFPKYSAQEWLEIINRDLKGKKSVEALFPEPIEGISLNPFAHAIDQLYDPVTHNPDGFKVMADIDDADEKSTNRKALHFLNNGANALKIKMYESFDINRVLNGIYPELIDLYLDCRNLPNPEHIQNHLSHADQKNKFHLLTDTNSLSSGVESSLPVTMLSKLLALCKTKVLNEGPVYTEIKVGDNLLLEIAKLRALRILWANLLNDTEGALSVPLYIQAVPDEQVLVEDADRRLIQMTYMTMSTVMGGGDYISLTRYTADDHLTDTAFHIQNILLLESSMGQVTDPLAGSYAIEDLTNQIAEKAWQKFIEVAGM